MVSLGVGGIIKPVFLMCRMARSPVTSEGSWDMREPVTVKAIVHPAGRKLQVGESGSFCPQYSELLPP